ncbi:MAG TPA: hypothetical protein VGG46_06830 [Terriglobales bacterium]|jgi:hypothetical protein
MTKSDDANKQMPTGSGSQGGTPLIAWWLYIAVMLGALLMAAGAVIALVHPAILVSPHDQINGAVHIYAGYLASRNLVLAILLVVLLSLRARGALSNLMVIVALIQLVDACIDCGEGRWAVVPGVLILGLIFFIGAFRLSGYPFWKREAWNPHY